MTAYTWHPKRPLPIASAETQPFWDACKQDRFLVQQCGDCSKFQYHYRGFCCHCWSSNVADHEIEGVGKVFTYTVIERNRMDGFADMVPYIVALIEIPEGLKILSNVIDCDPDVVEIGMDVKLGFVDAADGVRLPIFRRAGA
jgi:uncharacterized OB-fold protein